MALSVAAATFASDGTHDHDLPVSRDVTWIELLSPLQVTGCRLEGERGGGSTIRPDQNCRVWCSVFSLSQTSNSQVSPSGTKEQHDAERVEVESDSELLLRFSCVSTAPLISGLVHILYCVCAKVQVRRLMQVFVTTRGTW